MLTKEIAQEALKDFNYLQDIVTKLDQFAEYIALAKDLGYDEVGNCWSKLINNYQFYKNLIRNDNDLNQAIALAEKIENPENSAHIKNCLIVNFATSRDNRNVCFNVDFILESALKESNNNLLNILKTVIEGSVIRLVITKKELERIYNVILDVLSTTPQNQVPESMMKLHDYLKSKKIPSLLECCLKFAEKNNLKKEARIKEILPKDLLLRLGINDEQPQVEEQKEKHNKKCSIQ